MDGHVQSSCFADSTKAVPLQAAVNQPDSGSPSLVFPDFHLQGHRLPGTWVIVLPLFWRAPLEHLKVTASVTSADAHGGIASLSTRFGDRANHDISGFYIQLPNPAPFQTMLSEPSTLSVPAPQSELPFQSHEPSSSPTVRPIR